MLRVILAVILAGLLTACGFGNPSQAIVEKAIALQLNQTQEELGQQLYRDRPQPSQFSVSRVKVARQDPLMIEDLKAYHVLGIYDLTLEFPDRKLTQKKNPFEVYLQRQDDDKSWRLARPQADGENGDRWALTEIRG